MGNDKLNYVLTASPTPRPRQDAGNNSGPGIDLRDLLCQAAGGTADIPIGWSRLRHDAERMLQSATTDVGLRRELRVTGVYVLGSTPVVHLTGHDAVVHGICRRTVARARHTCQICGRTGHVWECLSQFQVLCARCAAPQVVAADLDALEALRQRRGSANQSIPVAELPARLVTAIAMALDTATSDGSCGQPRVNQSTRHAITRQEFDRWCQWFLALRESPKFVELIGSAR